MAFTHSQLMSLAAAPSTTKSEVAYNQIKDALVGNPHLSHVSFTPYLQGSYSNKTNIKEDSDIDVVIEMTSTFRGETSSLNAYELSEYHRIYSNSQYSYTQFRNDVLNTLIREFGRDSVENHNKCIKVLGNNNRLNADVVPAMNYREYKSFSVYNKKDYTEGIVFWTTKEQKKMTNFPRVHKENGEMKNAQHRTDEKFKNFVRILKNLRGRLVELQLLKQDQVASYNIECLVYNTPDTHFVADYTDTFKNIIKFFLNHPSPELFLTVSHQHKLFGLEDHQWKVSEAQLFVALLSTIYAT